jgi:uncharacterized membrane protein
LALFFGVFAGVVLGLAWGGMLRFGRPGAFWLLGLAPWFWWLSLAGGAGLGRGRVAAALLVRLAMVGLFVLVLAEPRAVRRSDRLSVIFALDVSDSVGTAAQDAALAWIGEAVAHKRETDEAGLVVFAREAAVELPPRVTFPFTTVGSVVPRDATDLARALRLAAALLPEGNPGRIVLVSDGNQTEGEVRPVLDELRARGLPVDVVGVDFDAAQEVWLERLELPRVVRRGEPFQASVLLSARQAGRGMLRLAEGGQVVAELPVEYGAGRSRFTLALPPRGPGYYEYAASLEAPPGGDFWKENNVALADLFLEGEGRVLVLTDAGSDAREWEPLVAALAAVERPAQVRMAFQAPREPRAYLPYDLVIVPNAPADAFDAAQLGALHDAVFHLGTGLLMLGSAHTFGPGGYRGTPIETALPVEMEVTQKKALPSGALVLALDNSGSMAMEVGGRTKLSLASRGALLALQTLNPRDWSAVYAVDTAPEEILPFGQHGVLSAELERKVLGIRVGGGGIYVYTALARAALALHGAPANIKHIILFADAADAEEQASPQDGTPAVELAASLAAAKITVSVVALGQESDKDTAFLRALAAAGRGRFYLTGDATTLPQIFVKEAITLKRTLLQERTFVPEVVFPSPVLKGLAVLPPLHGYVLATPKARAQVVLQAPPSAEPGHEGELPDPILATWRYGLGATAAWTSDLTASWARDWLGWEKHRAFVQQLVTELARTEQRSDLHLRAFASGGTGIIMVEDFAKEESFLDLAARVTGPRGEARDVPLRQIAPRRYQATFPLWGKGRYQVMAAGNGTASDGERRAQALGGFAVPYSAEYLRFQSDPLLLREIAARTGGRVLAAASTEIFSPTRDPRESSRPVFDWFLLALCGLLPLDVGLRRIQLDREALRAWFRPREAAGRATLDALLARRSQSQEPRPAPGPTRPAPVSRPPAARPATPPSPPTPAPEPPAGPQGTVGALLARKRQRQDGGK